MHEQGSGHPAAQEPGKSGGEGGREGEGKRQMEAETARVRGKGETESGRPRERRRNERERGNGEGESASAGARAETRVRVRDARDTVKKEEGVEGEIQGEARRSGVAAESERAGERGRRRENL